jgi:hypothetical protein
MPKRQPTPKPIHNKSDVERIIADIRTLKDNGKSNEEIRLMLGISLRSYQRYTKRIHDENKRIWFAITQESLGTELLRMKKSLEKTFRISEKMAEDPKSQDRIDWLNAMNDSRLNIIKLLVEYPDFEKKVIKMETFDEEQEQDNDTASTLKRVHS